MTETIKNESKVNRKEITNSISICPLSDNDGFITFKITLDLDEIWEQLKTNTSNDNIQSKDIKNFMLNHPEEFKECLKIFQNVINDVGTEECFDNKDIQNFCDKYDETIEKFKIASKSKKKIEQGIGNIKQHKRNKKQPKM